MSLYHITFLAHPAQKYQMSLCHGEALSSVVRRLSVRPAVVRPQFQNASSSPFLTRFQFCLLYVIALGDGFKTSTQNFDL